MSGEHA
jgi:hypothetical protein